MIDLALAIVPQIEIALGCIIEVDAAVIEEATTRASMTLDQINMKQPNEVKQAGHYAFWIRKLKPLRVIDLAELQSSVDQLADNNYIVGKITEIQSIVPPPPQSGMFINEIFSIIAAIAIARTGGYRLDISKESLHDLATTLRYHSFSPGSLSATLWAYVQSAPPRPHS